MIRKEGYDACFMLKPSSTKSIMAFMAGIKRRIGFTGKNDMITDAVETPSPEIHRADHILSLATVFDIRKADGTYEFYPRNEDLEKAEDLLHALCENQGKMVVLNPGGNWDAKRWPAENYIELAKNLIDTFSDVQIIVTGAEKDRSLASGIVRAVGSDRCNSIAGETGIAVLAAVFKKAALVISADSGPLHLASATGTTTIGLFGPTSEKITGPRGRGRNIIISKHVNCRIPCYVENCDKDFECMKMITVKDVNEQAKSVLNNNS